MMLWEFFKSATYLLSLVVIACYVAEWIMLLRIAHLKRKADAAREWLNEYNETSEGIALQALQRARKTSHDAIRARNRIDTQESDKQ